jgi:predicted PurR-regulated permease PerM
MRLVGCIGGKLLISLKSKLIAYFLITSFIIGCFIAFISSINKIAQLRAEIKQLQTQLQNCKDTNQQLINQLQIQQENYIKAQKQLQEAYNKPAKRVYIKQTIKEPIYIANEDCQKMVDLIKQAEEQLK